MPSPIEKEHDSQGSTNALPSFVIPKNVVTKYAFATRVGYTPSNPAKVNQDSFILCPNIAQVSVPIEGSKQSIYQQHMFCVCDGHGHQGREVSQFIKDKIPRLLHE